MDNSCAVVSCFGLLQSGSHLTLFPVSVTGKLEGSDSPPRLPTVTLFAEGLRRSDLQCLDLPTGLQPLENCSKENSPSGSSDPE